VVVGSMTEVGSVGEVGSKGGRGRVVVQDGAPAGGGHQVMPMLTKQSVLRDLVEEPDEVIVGSGGTLELEEVVQSSLRCI
jgi:hypothetical protein